MGRRTSRKGPLRSLVYVSDARLEELFDQIEERRRRSILQKLRLSFGIKVPPIDVVVESKSADESARNRSRAARAAVVEECIRQESQVGDLVTGTDWITGRVDMEWAPGGDDGQTVLFCGYAGPLLVVLHGSPANLIGQRSAEARTGSYSYAVRAAIQNVDAPESLGAGLAAAAREMAGFTPQPVRFLAQVVRRGPLSGDQQREYVLASPLYIEHARRAGEGPDASARGAVRWLSADREWGLIAPDGDADAIVFGSGATDGDHTPLAPGQRVEFRVTHGTAGILATSVRPLDPPVSLPGPQPAPGPRGQPLKPTDPGRIGRFEILRRLGEGSMGVVYLAQDEEHGLVAIKVIRPGYARDPEFLHRFQDEADNASRVRGPNVARVIAAVTDIEQPYLVTEFVDGLTLEEHVEQRGPLSGRSAIEISAGIAAALEAIHQVGIVHRDLTPANVVLSRSGPKVIDFGIARAPGSGSRHTQAGMIVGTPPFMSPEQTREESLTPASDVFSWAALVVFATAGHQPFGAEGDPTWQVWQAIRSGGPNLSGVPRPLLRVVSAALNKEPARRPAAVEVSRAVQACLTEPAVRPRRWPRLAAVAALAGIAAVVITVIVRIDVSHGGTSSACPATSQPGLHPVTRTSRGASAAAGLVICPVRVASEKGPVLNTSLSGTLVGRLPAGQFLVVVTQPDPRSCAMDGSKGTGGYYLAGPVHPDSEGRWRVTSGGFYSGAQSLQRHIYFLLGSRSAVNSFGKSRAAYGAAHDGDASQWPGKFTLDGFQLLGTFTFTPVHPANRYCAR
jgi:cold shock CspA family protein/predicted Ser/Thr protein kinase